VLGPRVERRFSGGTTFDGGAIFLSKQTKRNKNID